MARKPFAFRHLRLSKQRRSVSQALLRVAVEVHDAPCPNRPHAQLDFASRCVHLLWSRAGRRKEYYIKPHGFTVAGVATARHGITHARAAAEGMPLSLALNEFLKDARAAVHSGGGMVSRPFDRAVLLHESARYGLAELVEICHGFWLDAERFPALMHAPRNGPPASAQPVSQQRCDDGHTPIKVYPSGHRDNNEVDWRCAQCGILL